MTDYATREEWLTEAIAQLWPYVYEAGAESMPAVRVSVGFPKGTRGAGSHRHGQIFYGAASADGTTEIFVSPELDEPLAVLDVLSHQLIHASLGQDAGHGSEFGAVARALGLDGKLTDTAPGDALTATLRGLANELGDYPHAQLTAGEEGGGLKKQGTRMLKIECESCGMVARTTAKWLDSPGLPTCACGGGFQVPE